MPNIVGVKFIQGGKAYYFDPGEIVFSVGDGAIVETAHGTEYGEVTIANTFVPQEEL